MTVTQANVSAAAAVSDRVKRHLLVDRVYHWLMAACVLTLLATAFLPIIGYKFEWLGLHWTTGVALQNLAFDSSMHEFVTGAQVPYWISLILCYATLLQRLVVPFGFYFKRYRIWSVLILGSMHIGYAILMYVNIFPLVGITIVMHYGLVDWLL